MLYNKKMCQLHAWLAENIQPMPAQARIESMLLFLISYIYTSYYMEYTQVYECVQFIYL